jgi:hypothetical protein
MVLVIIQFVMNIFLWEHFGSAKNGADSTLFVIGNALMGAIILWQLVAKPGSLLKRSRHPGN